MARTANNTTATANNTNNTNKEEKNMKNYTTMKKAELIALIEEQEKELKRRNNMIKDLEGTLMLTEAKVEGLGDALKAVKKAMMSFKDAMNDVYTADIVKNATAEIEPQKIEAKKVVVEAEKRVEAPKKPDKATKTTKTTKKVKTEGKKVVAEETPKPEKKRWLTKEEYKAQFTPEQQEAWKLQKQNDVRIRNEVAAEMRAEAKMSGVYWKKAEYKVEFEKRVNARKEAK